MVDKRFKGNIKSVKKDINNFLEKKMQIQTRSRADSYKRNIQK
jgi:hypothetical protein